MLQGRKQGSFLSFYALIKLPCKILGSACDLLISPYMFSRLATSVVFRLFSQQQTSRPAQICNMPDLTLVYGISNLPNLDVLSSFVLLHVLRYLFQVNEPTDKSMCEFDSKSIFLCIVGKLDRLSEFSG